MTKPELESVENLSLITAIYCHAMEKPNHQALIFLGARGEEQTVATFAEVYADLRCAAWGWHQLGVEPGSVVLLALDHSYELVIAFLGALYAGAVPVILPYPRIKGLNSCAEQIQLLAEFTGAAAVSTTASVAELLQSQPEVLKFGLHVFNLAQAEMPPSDFCAHQRGNEQVLYLQLTSGTTGTPKLAMLSQKAVMTNIRRVFEARYQSGGTVAGCMPFNHDGGLVLCLLIPLVMGRLSVQLSPSHWIAQPDVFWDAVAAYRVAITFLPNFALGFMTRRIEHCQPAQYNLSSLHTIIVGAELVTHHSLDSFYHHFCECGLKEESLCAGYGMAEQVVGVSFSPVGSLARIDWVAQERLQAEGVAQPVATDKDARAVVCCGDPLPGLQVVIVDGARHLLPERTVGEVLVRSEHCFNGYFNRPDLTVPVMHGDWYCTGDLGYLADGELFILGRKDDLIIVAGENIQPQAIEEIALAVLGVRGRLAVAFGVRDEQLGTQRPVLVCETRHNEPAEQLAAWRAEILNQVQNRLNVTLADLRFAAKGWVIQSDAKIARAACHQKYLAEFTPVWLEANVQTVTIRAPRPQLDTPFISPRNELEEQITDLWAELLDLDEVGIDDNFFDLGGDSLTALRMALEVEEATGQRVPPEFFRLATVAHLAEMIPVARPPENLTRHTVTQRTVDRSAGRPQRLTPRHVLTYLTSTGPVWRGRGLPYDLGVRLQRLWIRLPLIRQRLLRHAAPFQKWLTILDRADSDGRELELSLLANTWRYWREASVQQFDIFTRWVTVHGADYLDTALASGRPIVLIGTHTAIRGEPMRMAIRQRAGREVWTLGNTTTGAPDVAAKIVYARELLARGGIVHVTGDGAMGQRGVELPIHGRPWLFRSGGAELAQETGALLLPVFNTLAPSGEITAEFQPPLTSAWSNRQQQIEDLTRQYAALLAERWPTLLSNMKWGKLQQMLDHSAKATRS